MAAGRERGREGLQLPLHPARRSRGLATRELLLREVLASRWPRMSAALAAVCTFLVSPAWQPLRPGQPNKPCFGYFILFPPSHFPLAESRLHFGPFFVLVLRPPGLEPVARCPPLPCKQLPFPLVSFAAVGSTTQTTSVTKLVLTGRSPVPEPTSWGLTAWLRWDLAAGGSGMLPEQPLAWQLPPPRKHKAQSGPGAGVSHQVRMPRGIPSLRYPALAEAWARGGCCCPIPGQPAACPVPSVLGGTACLLSPRCCQAWECGLVSRAWG